MLRHCLPHPQGQPRVIGRVNKIEVIEDGLPKTSDVPSNAVILFLLAMRPRTFTTCLRTLAALGALLGNLGVQPGLSHSHAHGMEPHSHGDCHVHSHVHPHATAPTSAGVFVVEENAQHTHVSFFGIKLSIRDFGPSSKPTPAAEKQLSEVAVLINAAASPIEPFQNSALLATIEPAFASVSAYLHRDRVTIVCAHSYLCDTARHERSGVLLS